MADALIEGCVQKEYDLVVLPGGIPGAEHLRDSSDLIGILKRQREKERLYGGICASPAVVLEHHGLLSARRATCHPGLVDQLTVTDRVESRVMVDGNCLTSRGPGNAVEFALALVERLYGKENSMLQSFMGHRFSSINHITGPGLNPIVFPQGAIQREHNGGSSAQVHGIAFFPDRDARFQFYIRNFRLTRS